ncbi:5' nucleotidase A isoform X3 [Lasioglossum baleicum]|uniref:5' nucleotidase A isoform X3 n=1 Tax=Lasioglossum baleicum TaxID=434251 RepID=UPI003FCDE4F3
MTQESQKEKFNLFNTLSILLRAVKNEKTTVDLRNEASVYGTVEHTDAGDSYNYDMFFVQARNIRYVHIPPKIRIVPAIKEQIQRLTGDRRTVNDITPTFRNIRAKRTQREGLAAVEKILNERRETEVHSTKSESNEN